MYVSCDAAKLLKIIIISGASALARQRSSIAKEIW